MDWVVRVDSSGVGVGATARRRLPAARVAAFAESRSAQTVLTVVTSLRIAFPQVGWLARVARAGHLLVHGARAARAPAEQRRTEILDAAQRSMSDQGKRIVLGS